MPYEFEWEAQGAFKRFSGFVTAEEFFASIQRFQSHPAFFCARYTINDFSAVEATDVAGKDVRRFAAFAAQAHQLNPKLRVAIVTADAALRHLIDSHLDVEAAGVPLRIFATLAEARQWTGPADPDDAAAPAMEPTGELGRL